MRNAEKKNGLVNDISEEPELLYERGSTIMQRVVLIRSNPVAPDPAVEKIADALVSNGYAVTILAWDRFGSYSVEKSVMELSQKVSVVRFGIKAEFGSGIRILKQLIQFQFRVNRWLVKHHKEYDIVHAFDFDTGFIACNVSRRYHKKFVYHILDFYVESHRLTTKRIGKYIKWAEFWTINQADVTILCTEKRREQIRGSKPKKLVIIHNTPQQNHAVDTEFVLEGDPNKCRIVYVGILGKGRYIQELAEIVTKDLRFEMHIGGFGPMEEQLRMMGKQYSNIFFYGRLPYEKTLSLEQQCHVMTAIYNPEVPNHRYAAPNKFYESLMLGKPVIMAKGTGFDDIITENANGYLMEYSHEGMVQALSFMYENKESFSQMGRRARELYDSDFSWDIMCQRITKLYNDL